MKKSICLAATLLAISAVQPASASVRALLIGINAYDGPPKLMGAVNDINDVAAVLKKGGIETEVLEDKAVTRAAVVGAYDKLLAESVAGDSLYVHFAGHGISIPDDNGDEADGKDESYLLAGFDEEKAPGEQLIDDDLDVLFQAARTAGVNVMFVADACHSGSPARAVGADALPTRLYQPKTTPTRPIPLGAAVAGGDNSFLTVVGATLDDKSIPELIIDGQPRGALSYATARALEGHADLDGNGEVVASEFEVYVRQTVRNLAASKQTPQFEVPDGSRQIVVLDRGRKPPPIPGFGLPVAELPETTVYLDHADLHPELSAELKLIKGVRIVDGGEAASLILDLEEGVALNAVRDVVASGLESPGDFSQVIEAHRALDGVNRLAIGGALAVGFFPNDAVQPAGTEITFSVERPKQAYLTAFDLTATGVVQAMWPLSQSDLDPWPEGRPFEFKADVSPPFGADNLVIVATDEPPEALRAVLAGSHVRPATLYAALSETARRMPMTIGVQAFFTEAQP